MFRWASFVVLIAIILLIGALFFQILASFLVPLFLAAILVVIFHPLHRRALDWLPKRPRLAALVTTLAAMLIVLVPALLVISLAVVEGVSIASQGALQDLPRRLRDLRTRLELDLPHEPLLRRSDAQFNKLFNLVGERRLVTREQLDDSLALLREWERELRDKAELPASQESLTATQEALQQAGKRSEFYEHEDAVLDAKRQYERFKTRVMGGPLWRTLTEWANPSDQQRKTLTANFMAAFQQYVLPIGGATAAVLLRILVGAAITSLSLYFFLADGPNMMKTIMRLSPLDDRYEQELLTEFSRVSRAVVLATLISAVVQGALAGIGFWFAAIHSVFLLTLLTVLFAMIPFVGAAAVWLPTCLWLYFVDERTFAAVGLAVYGTFIVSLSDNLVKPLVLHGQSRLHPLLALLSVLGGVQAMGPVGILVGPMVVVCLQSLLNILHRELGQLEQKLSKARGRSDAKPKLERSAAEPPGTPEDDQPPPDESAT